ncbi:MAG: universal stress protein, partial [Myxococcaceae bacterium]|nr:universal stress protein [Myxococcaceae bacterium]
EGAAASQSPTVELFNAERELRRELRELLPDAPGADRLRVSGGAFVRDVCEGVSRDGAALVVLPDTARAGERAAVISRQTRVPVLVARAKRPAGGVLGTTAMQHRRYPVIKQAQQVAAWLEAPLMVLHNRPQPDDIFTVASFSARLVAVARDLAPGAAVVVGRHEHPVDGILEGERRFGCDVLVVGTSVGHREHVSSSVAECVAQEAKSSVLVTPME